MNANFADRALEPVDLIEADSDRGLASRQHRRKFNFTREFLYAVDERRHAVTIEAQGNPVPFVGRMEQRTVEQRKPRFADGRKKSVKGPTRGSQTDFEQGTIALGILRVEKTLFSRSVGRRPNEQFDGELLQAPDRGDRKDEAVVGAVEDDRGGFSLVDYLRVAEYVNREAPDFFGSIERPKCGRRFCRGGCHRRWRGRSRRRASGETGCDAREQDRAKNG